MRGRGFTNLPDTVTLLNLFFGFTSIVFSVNEKLCPAGSAILAAAAADCLDGFLARRKDTASKFGKELDSLADLVSFGVAPGILLYTMFDYSTLAVFTALIPLCGAIRLARFNITDVREGFMGLPIPAAGGFIATLPFLNHSLSDWLLLSIIIILSDLMISEIKYFKYSSKPREKPVLIYILTASIIPPLLNLKLLFVPFLVYILSGFFRK